MAKGCTDKGVEQNCKRGKKNGDFRQRGREKGGENDAVPYEGGPVPS